MSEEKIEAAKAKVQCLQEAGFIREVRYPQWLANVMMVCKKNGKCAHISPTLTSVAPRMISLLPESIK
jgi:hypothetical protein